MIIKELIEKLNEYDENAVIKVLTEDEDDFGYATDIKNTGIVKGFPRTNGVYLIIGE